MQMQKILDETLALYSEEYPGYADLKEILSAIFKEHDVKYETLGLEVHSILDGTALVTHDQKLTFNEKDSLEHIYYLRFRKR